MICFLSAALTSPVLGKDSALFITNYFSPLDFSEIDQFNLLSIDGCISVAIAKDILHMFRQE